MTGHRGPLSNVYQVHGRSLSQTMRGAFAFFVFLGPFHRGSWRQVAGQEVCDLFGHETYYQPGNLPVSRMPKW